MFYARPGFAVGNTCDEIAPRKRHTVSQHVMGYLHTKNINVYRKHAHTYTLHFSLFRTYTAPCCLRSHPWRLPPPPWSRAPRLCSALACVCVFNGAHDLVYTACVCRCVYVSMCVYVCVYVYNLVCMVSFMSWLIRLLGTCSASQWRVFAVACRGFIWA